MPPVLSPPVEHLQRLLRTSRVVERSGSIPFSPSLQPFTNTMMNHDDVNDDDDDDDHDNDYDYETKMIMISTSPFALLPETL